MIIADLNDAEKDMVIAMTAGPLLGSGWHRDVYAMEYSEHYAIKIENRKSEFANVKEWATWEMVQYTDHAKWFAPCCRISLGGLVMIQRRTWPITDEQWAEVEELPWFFDDIKKDNFGFFEDRIVCHDYAWNGFAEHGLKSKKMQKKKVK